MDREVITNSDKETQQISSETAHSLKGGETLLLYGDLGSGKTTFTQGLAKALGVQQRVISPTFLILRRYHVPQHEKINMLYHADLYRIGHEQEVQSIGLTDIMHDPKGVTIIEWPERLGKYFPEKRIDIRFEYVDETRRKITIQSKI